MSHNQRPLMLLNTVVCIPGSSLPQKMNQVSGRKKNVLLFPVGAFLSALSSQIDFSLRAPSVWLSVPASFSPSLPGPRNLVTFSAPFTFVSPSLLHWSPFFFFFCPLPTLTLFCCRCTFKPAFICIYISFAGTRLYSICTRLSSSGGKASFLPTCNQHEKSQPTFFFFVASWTVIEDNEAVVNSRLQIKGQGCPRLCPVPTLYQFTV